MDLLESCVSFESERTDFQNKVLAGLQGGFNHLYSHGLLFDLTVAIGDETFECHRFMLAAASDFFKASLTSSWCESSSRLVRLDHSDVTSDSFRLLLDILYEGKDVVTMTTARGILKMAIFLQIKFLQDDVKAYLSDNMSADTCIGIWQFAELYELKQLAQEAADLAVTEFELVSICDEFLDIPKTFLLILLSSVTSSRFTSTKLSENARQMDCLFYAILRWVEADADSRKTHLPELLPFVCFPQLTPGCLDKAVAYLNHPFRDVMFG
ncbi:hypothetical protein BaRGS_00039139 [Batillaria attramentaria]|uniref:BTB domain-containing protein n=1 Tax=Batillaria attramentaria TaxID=370345 RepID=A0ABD0J4T7_9CAEN